MANQKFPSFSFNESNVGPRAVRTATVDTIGIVGMFAKGPLTPLLVDGDTALAIYGKTNDVGSAHLQAMIDQGADAFVVNRVLGTTRTAFLNTTIVGTVSGAGSLSIDIKLGGTTVTASVSLSGSETGSQVATSVVSAVNALVTNTYVTASVGSGSSGTNGAVVYTAKSAHDGTAGNSIQIRYTLATSTGLTFGPGSIGTTLTNLAGGENGPATSVATIINSSSATVFTLTALSPGVWGNSISTVLALSIETGKYDLTISHAASGITEVYRGVDFTDLYDEDKLTPFRNSLLVRGTLVNASLVPVANTYTASGGTDGATTILTSDFTAAIDEMKDYTCTILTCPGLKPSGVSQTSIDSALVAQAEALDQDFGELVGLRIAVLSAPRGTVIADLPTMKTAGSIPNSKRAVMVMGWATSAKLTTFKRFGIDPAALYAGRLMRIRPEVSPAARTSAPTYLGITEVDTPVGRVAWNSITDYRLDAIILDPVLGGFHNLNGRSTSSDAAWYWIAYRRVTDRIRSLIFINLQFIKSEPSDSRLDSVVEGTTNGILGELAAQRMIAGYDPAVSNSTNNPIAVRAAGKRYVDFGIEYIPANDQTEFRLNRVAQASIRVA